MLVFVVCQYGYVAILTRDVLVPVGGKSVQTIHELTVETGKRWMIPNNALALYLRYLPSKPKQNTTKRPIFRFSDPNYILVDKSLENTHGLPSPLQMAQNEGFTV